MASLDRAGRAGGRDGLAGRRRGAPARHEWHGDRYDGMRALARVRPPPSLRSEPRQRPPPPGAAKAGAAGGLVGARQQ